MSNKKVFNIKDEVRRLPETPGVYLMHNEVDEIIYVGKAVNLKARVSQYFHHNDKRQKRIEQMIANIRWFEVIRVETELEALLLESNLIKQYRPRYNSALRKDENHPYLRIDLSEPFPVIAVTTDNARDEAMYIGPFYKSMEIEKAVDWISKYYGLRSCSKNLRGTLPEGHPCMYYTLGQCLGPCQGETDPDFYRRQLDKAVQFFLTQDSQTIWEELHQSMESEAADLNFEKAGQYKRMMTQLDELLERMDFRSREEEENIDLFAVASEQTKAVILLYLIRGGRLSGRDSFTIEFQEKTKQSDSRILQAYVQRFYQNSPFIPGKVILTERIKEQKELAQILTNQKGKPVVLSCPRTGEKGRFVQMARENARELLMQQRKK